VHAAVDRERAAEGRNSTLAARARSATRSCQRRLRRQRLRQRDSSGKAHVHRGQMLVGLAFRLEVEPQLAAAANQALEAEAADAGANDALQARQQPRIGAQGAHQALVVGEHVHQLVEAAPVRLQLHRHADRFGGAVEPASGLSSKSIAVSRRDADAQRLHLALVRVSL
jgi:hypothetical protein